MKKQPGLELLGRISIENPDSYGYNLKSAHFHACRKKKGDTQPPMPFSIKCAPRLPLCLLLFSISFSGTLVSPCTIQAKETDVPKKDASKDVSSKTDSGNSSASSQSASKSASKTDKIADSNADSKPQLICGEHFDSLDSQSIPPEKPADSPVLWLDDLICFADLQSTLTPKYPAHMTESTALEKEYAACKNDSQISACSSANTSKKADALPKIAADLKTAAVRLIEPASGQILFTDSAKTAALLENQGFMPAGSTLSVFDLLQAFARYTAGFDFPESEDKTDRQDDKKSAQDAKKDSSKQTDQNAGESAGKKTDTAASKAAALSASSSSVSSASSANPLALDNVFSDLRLMQSKSDGSKAAEFSNSITASKDKTAAVYSAADQALDTSDLSDLIAAQPAMRQDTLSLRDAKFGPWAQITDDGIAQIFVLSDGSLASGQTAIGQAEYFYSAASNTLCRDVWVLNQDEKNVCYYDENGQLARSPLCINGRLFCFDPADGHLLIDYDELESKVEALIKKYSRKGEQIAFALRDLSTGDSIVLHSKAQQSASVMKAFVMGAIFEKYEEYTKRYGKSYIDGQLSVMISISDNNAWVALVEVLGGGSYVKGISVLNKWNKEHGYLDTTMSNVPYGNYTSAKDASQILADIADGKLKHAKDMKKLLESQAISGRLLQGLPASGQTGNKPGWVAGTENDTVLVEAPFGEYVITLLCTDMMQTSRATQLMKEISSLVYSWMKENHPPADANWIEYATADSESGK